MKPSDIQKFCRDFLSKDAALVGARVGVSAQDDGNFRATLEKALGLGGSGIHVIVSSPTFRPESSAAKNAVGRVTFKVAVSEVPAINRKRQGHIVAADLAWHIAALLNQVTLGADEHIMLVLDGEIAPAMDADGASVVYSIPFVCMNQLKGLF